jgi:hypothetical protein
MVSVPSPPVRLSSGGRSFLGGWPTTEVEDRVQGWLDVPMFFAGVEGEPV